MTAGSAAAGTVLVDRPAAGVARIRLNRPERRNALSMAMRREIAAAVSTAAAAPDVRAIILAGSPTCFASGGDIVENATMGAIDTLQRGREKRALWQTLSSCGKPLVAAVRGYALGGGAELMMLADVIVASTTARIGQPEVRVGIIPGSGGTQRLPRAVGPHAALGILLTGGAVSGARAACLGWVSAAVDDETVEPYALELACAIARNAALAVTAAKECVLAAEGPLESGLALERAWFSVLASSEDCREGMDAQLRRREPAFRGC